ncbi:MAG: hypothetical protein K2X47_18270, partial [Bdellovibrionales bacterium]|nr:hypothetical protein [Bdellovibrionales bacterium]
PNSALYPCGTPVPTPPGSCAVTCGLGTGPAGGPDPGAGNPATIQGAYPDSCNYCTQVGTCVPDDGPDGISGTADDVVCATPGCGGTLPFPPACPTMGGAACPILEFRPNGSAGPYNSVSFPQRGAPVQMRVAGGGLPGACTVEYNGHQDGLTNAVIGPVSTNTNPTYNTTFNTAGPGTNFQGFRTMTLDCGGTRSDFEYRAQCGPMYGMPADQCAVSCVSATCR